MRIAIWAPILAVSVLAGCDSSGVRDFDSVSQSYNDMRSDVLAMPVSSSSTMPISGGAVYEGYSTVSINPGGSRNTALVGDATLQANFSNASLTGSLDNFIGQINGGEVQDIAGSLSIRDGEIGIGRSENLTADLTGRLRASDGARVDIDGGVAGRFRDNGNVRAAALTAVDTNSTDFFVNGVRQRDGTVNIVARQ